MVSIAASMRRQLCPPFQPLCASVFPPTTSCFCHKLFARLHLERRRHRTQIENHPCNPSRPSQIAYTATWHADGSGDRKYINNQHPTSCVPLSAPSEAHNIAAFLVSFQHVQWEKTKKELFVSNYQGACGLLTDPQITNNGRIFGEGNIPAAFTNEILNQPYLQRILRILRFNARHPTG